MSLEKFNKIHKLSLNYVDDTFAIRNQLDQFLINPSYQFLNVKVPAEVQENKLFSFQDILVKRNEIHVAKSVYKKKKKI